MKMDGVDLVRSPNDSLAVGVNSAIHPDFNETLALVLITYGLPLPDMFSPPPPPGGNWIVLFTVPNNWWQAYIEDWIPCPESWIDGINPPQDWAKESVP